MRNASWNAADRSECDKEGRRASNPELKRASGATTYGISISIARALEPVEFLMRCLHAQGMTCRDLAARLKLSEAASSACRATGDEPAALGAGRWMWTWPNSVPRPRGRPAMASPSVGHEQALVDEQALLLVLFPIINRWHQDDVLMQFDFTWRNGTRGREPGAGAGAMFAAVIPALSPCAGRLITFSGD